MHSAQAEHVLWIALLVWCNEVILGRYHSIRRIICWQQQQQQQEEEQPHHQQQQQEQE
jgi:hypothetical protein